METQATGAVQEIQPRDETRDLSTLGRIDYEDCFLVRTDSALADRTAEEWARAMVEGASKSMRDSLVRGWRMLGLRNGSTDDPDRVLGWEIRRNEPDVVLLGADSWIGMPGELLYKREPDGLLFATFIGQSNPAAKLVWAPVGGPHRRIVAELLADAAVRLRRQGCALQSRRGPQSLHS
jgi:hypothetical protein